MTHDTNLIRLGESGQRSPSPSGRGWGKGRYRSGIKQAMHVAITAVLFLAASGAQAQQNYPEKTVRLIVPYAAGGNGYTLAFIASGHSINPGMYAKMPFDPIRDFAPVAQTSSTPILIAVTAALPAKTVKALAALAKARPGDLSYASQGNGSPGHLAGALFNSMNNVNIMHIPYKSTSQAITDLTSGQVQLMYPSATSILPHVKSGRLHAVAIATKARSALAPDIPTAGEAGLPGFEAGIWNGVVAPVGTAPAIIEKLYGAIAKIIRSPDTHERILGMGADPIVTTPTEFSTFIATELKKWTKVIKESGAKLD